MAVRMLGRKLGMTQVYSETGERIPVTVIEAGPATVVQVKTGETDGYDAIQLGYGERKPSFRSRPLAGHFKRAGIRPLRFLRESRVAAEEIGSYSPGQQLTVAELFQVGDRIDVSGTSKGRGFTGVMKRHGFSGKPASHGTHEAKRHGGSIGMHTRPGRVLKGTKMAGQHGDKRVTVQGLEVVAIKPEENLLLVRGGVPGGSRALVLISTSVKAAKA